MTTFKKVAGAALAIAAVGGLSACNRSAGDGAPPRATDAITSPPQSSIIAVPIEADIGALRAALEREVPRQLWTIDKPDQVCVPSKKVKVLVVKIKTPTLKCRLVGQVTRGALSIGGSGRDLIVTMPVSAVIRAQDIGGILKQETATARAQVRIAVRMDLASDWNPRSKVDINYAWTKQPGVEFLGQTIDLTHTANDKLAGVVASLERTVPVEINKLGFRQQVEKAWGEAFTSVPLNRDNPPVWMRITPQELQYGGYNLTGTKLTLRLGMKAQTETFVGDRPADPPSSPLPPVRPLDANTGSLQFFIPVIADYAELEPVISEALVKRSDRPFDIPGYGPVNASFGKVTAYGTTDGRIAVGLQFAAADAASGKEAAKGTVWLTGLPINPPNTQKVMFTDVKVSGATDSTGTNLLLKLANSPALSQTIAEALAQNFTRDYNELLGKISRAIDDKREGKLAIQARIDNVRTGSLKAAGNGLYLPVWGTGTAAIRVLH
ncbi:uncharacterized protein DUF4403 [Novosphingobium kunmingense]|uniref:Uncharacterized protein DUF4403 n=1 Tax=Novosphingobium kunmingense TaxID=1211806 RepID=A0A2N0H374_9SPHN|nr:DUF4403 family protein [Novosphingobium kunmingense]PKB13378.1 uncharacterized protein DUF4403 [Novosphingobium kunmingense]